MGHIGRHVHEVTYLTSGWLDANDSQPLPEVAELLQVGMNLWGTPPPPRPMLIPCESPNVYWHRGVSLGLVGNQIIIIIILVIILILLLIIILGGVPAIRGESDHFWRGTPPY